MDTWTVIIKRPDGGIDFEAVEADSFRVALDPISVEPGARYYVFEDATGREVARFNERDIVGVRKGLHVELDVRLSRE